MQPIHARSVLILTGAFGSGKTECALALARHFAAVEPVTLVDLDFVNPYFRVLDHRAALQAEGITLIAPEESRAAIDAPAMPPAAATALTHPHGRTVVDIGGDPVGARVLGQFAPRLTNCDFWAVLNFSRPTTADPAPAAELLTAISTAAGVRLTGLVSNTHLGPGTTVADIEHGLALTRMVAKSLAVPVTLVCAVSTLHVPPLEVPVLALTLQVRKPWERD